MPIALSKWRLQYGLGLLPANRVALAVGTRHLERKAVAERVAGGSIGVGKALMVAAVLELARRMRAARAKLAEPIAVRPRPGQCPPYGMLGQCSQPGSNF